MDERDLRPAMFHNDKVSQQLDSVPPQRQTTLYENA